MTSFLGRLGCHISMVALFVFALWTGAIGLDFGKHWDEGAFLNNAVIYRIEQETLLPQHYLYPAFSYDLALLAIIPSMNNYYRDKEFRTLGWVYDAKRIDGYRRALSGVAHSQEFLLRVRLLFLFVSLLVIPGVYAALYFARGKGGEALIGAAFAGLSWEVAYHSRWIAPDAIMMAIGALFLAAVIRAAHTENAVRWLWVAAVLAGVAGATKYPGALLLVPLLIMAWTAAPNKHLPAVEKLVLVFKLATVTALAYLVITPGTLVDFVKFSDALIYNMKHYKSSHWGYTVEAGWDHAALMARYVAFHLFSQTSFIAAVIFLFSLWGAGVVIRQPGPDRWNLILFPLLYSAYFSSQRVMIVRNYLLLIPFLAVLAAIGWTRLQEVLKGRGLRHPGLIMQILLVAGLAWNGWGLYADAYTIRDGGDWSAKAAAYVETHSSAQFFLSPRLAQEFQAKGKGTLANTSATTCTEGGFVAFWSSEVKNASLWIANHPESIKAVFGPRETNFAYYPSWQGQERIVILPRRTAQPFGFCKN